MNHFAVHLKLTQYCKLTIFHYKIKNKLKKKKNPMQEVGRGRPGHMLNNARVPVDPSFTRRQFTHQHEGDDAHQDRLCCRKRCSASLSPEKCKSKP